jgi:NPCBM/NEW2 domain-containing protein
MIEQRRGEDNATFEWPGRGMLRLPGRMWRRRKLLWAILGGVVVAVAVVLALTHAGSDTAPNAASSPAPPVSTGASTQDGGSAPVVTPETSSSLSYLSDMKPSGNFAQLVNRGPVKISGSIYPKSISFYCNVGDATAFPVYKLKRHARRFEATVGLAAGSPPGFQAGIILVGGERTLRMFTVGVPKPKTVDVDVRGVHTLQLECFGSGNSTTGGEAVGIAWGNARVSGDH